MSAELAALDAHPLIGLGVVGSQAYGLSTPDSDVDRLGVYVAPTESFLGLTPPTGKAATRVADSSDGDIALHEAGKFVGLVLQGNPTVSELLWLDNYEVTGPEWAELVAIRHRLLSARRVRDAYYGYARGQIMRLGNPSQFGGSNPARREKHARHALRLLDQGLHAYEHGEIKVRVDDPGRYFEFGRSCVESMQPALDALTEASARFDSIRSPLPEEPDTAAAENWLIRLRRSRLESA